MNENVKKNGLILSQLCFLKKKITTAETVPDPLIKVYKRLSGSQSTEK